MRRYTVILAVGTGACLLIAGTVTLPAAAGILGQTVTPVARAEGPVAVLDGLAPLLVLVVNQSLFWRTWLRRHGHRLPFGRRAVTHGLPDPKPVSVNSTG